MENDDSSPKTPDALWQELHELARDNAMVNAVLKHNTHRQLGREHAALWLAVLLAKQNQDLFKQVVDETSLKTPAQIIRLLGEEVGARIKMCRDETGLSETALAEKVGVPQSVINQLESGYSYTVERIESIGKALNVSATWLSTGRGSKQRKEEDGGNGSVIPFPTK